MSKFLGDPIDQKVADQITARGKIVGAKNRGPDTLKFLNSKTSWVRLTSGVDTNGSSDESKKLILQGGSGFYNSTEDKLFLKGGISFRNNDQDITKTYNTTGGFGTRPMPGITDFSVKCKGRFGVIKEADISFNVWSLEDLERVESLFFRLGYSCIVEWGNSIYVDNTGTVVNGGLTKNYGNFFESPSSREKAQVILDEQKESTYYNYDGLIGLIKNFSWGFRADGGYDCTLSIVSLGEIIESLRADKSPIDLEPFPGGEKESESTRVRSSYFGALLYGLTDQTLTDGSFTSFKNVKVEKGQSSFDRFVSNLTVSENQGGLGNRTPLGAVGKNVVTDRTEGAETNEVAKIFYITLRSFLAIINRFYLLKVEGRTEPRFDLSLENAPKFNTHKGHFSSDPLTCLVPDTPEGRSVKGLKINELYEGPSDAILNIPVSLNYLVETYTAIADRTDSQDFSVFDLVKNVLSGIENSLGRINEFDITYDDDRRLYSIVDRNKIDTVKTVLPELDLVGLKTTVIDLKIESKISSRLGSTIAIAAQSSPQSTTRLLSSLVEWNKGKVDRFAVAKTDDLPDIEEVLQQSLKIEKFEETLSSLFEKLNRTPGEYVKTEWDNLQKETYQVQIKANQDSRKKNNFPLAGIIPIDISFTFDGISGLKIGQSVRFKKGFLLPKYDIFSYIITGIDHFIGSDSRWKTELRFNPVVYP